MTRNICVTCRKELDNFKTTNQRLFECAHVICLMCLNNIEKKTCPLCNCALIKDNTIQVLTLTEGDQFSAILKKNGSIRSQSNRIEEQSRKNEPVQLQLNFLKKQLENYEEYVGKLKVLSEKL
ncbi:hypothetical protein SNEBB_001494 [Seison nebaliae]|nr:hypothetical protein SNEBB_001494 [Seison nebaliae]